MFVSLPFISLLTLMLLLDCSGAVLYGLLAVATHEAGHLLAMCAVKCPPRELIFLPYGISIRRGGCGASAQLVIAAAGVAANLLAAALLWRSTEPAAANLAIALFNLAPVRGLDGFDILYLLLARRLDIDTARRACAVVGCVVLAAAAAALAAFCRNPALLLCIAYLVVLTVMNLRC